MIEASTRELIADAERLTGSVMAENEKRFEQVVAKAIAGSPLIGAYAPAGLTALQLARTLHATARGLKESPCRGRRSLRTSKLPCECSALR